MLFLTAYTTIFSNITTRMIINHIDKICDQFSIHNSRYHNIRDQNTIYIGILIKSITYNYKMYYIIIFTNSLIVYNYVAKNTNELFGLCFFVNYLWFFVSKTIIITKSLAKNIPQQQIIQANCKCEMHHIIYSTICIGWFIFNNRINEFINSMSYAILIQSFITIGFNILESVYCEPTPILYYDSDSGSE